MRPVIILPNKFIFIKNLDKSARVTNVKSSNPKLVAAKRPGMDAISLEPYYDEDDWELPDLSNISSVISFKVQQNNKTYSLSCRITTKPAMSPVSSFQIGSKNIAKYFDKYTDISGFSVKGKQKVSIKMAPGYVLDSITFQTNGKQKRISNGATIDFPSQYYLTILYHTTKKPANYIAPSKWSGKVPSPLHELLGISAGFWSKKTVQANSFAWT